MRLIVLLLAVAITGVLVMRQLEQATPVTVQTTSGDKTEVAMPYGKQIGKARALENSMQEDVDERLEQMDAMGK